MTIVFNEVDREIIAEILARRTKEIEKERQRISDEGMLEVFAYADIKRRQLRMPTSAWRVDLKHESNWFMTDDLIEGEQCQTQPDQHPTPQPPQLK